MLCEIDVFYSLNRNFIFGGVSCEPFTPIYTNLHVILKLVKCSSKKKKKCYKPHSLQHMWPPFQKNHHERGYMSHLFPCYVFSAPQGTTSAGSQAFSVHSSRVLFSHIFSSCRTVYPWPSIIPLTQTLICILRSGLKHNKLRVSLIDGGVMTFISTDNIPSCNNSV